MTNHVQDKTIIVTGAASGFGRLICQKAISAGAKVVCADINEGLLNTVVQELIGAGGRAIGQHTDVSDLSQMRGLATKAV